MERLTRSLRQTLRGLQPFDGKEEFGRAFMDQKSLVPGVGPYQLLSDLRDLEDLGLIRILRTGKRVDAVVLTAKGRDYSRNSKLEIAKAAGRYLFQLLVGASGGLVALFASRLLQ